MDRDLDVVLINPGNRKQVYQVLGIDLAAVEPPFWIGLIATFLRNNGFSVKIIDSNAENYIPEETANKVKELNPLISAVIVYGSQPSASTQNMTISSEICKALKEKTDSYVLIGGLHPSSLPEKTLKETEVDFVAEGEGPYTLKVLIEELKKSNPNFENVPGLWYYGELGEIKSNPKAPNINSLDDDLPVVAWDLLPMQKYKAHNWHCFDHIEEREPYAVIYTSLGCPYNCVFCCINAPFGKPGIRYRGPEKVVEEIDLLVKEYGVKNIKIVDELFVLQEKHYMKIVDLLLERDYDLNIWCYARVDTVKPNTLKKMKQAGFNWFALGIESANPDVRDGASKKMRNRDIKQVVKDIQDAGIRVIGNYIFGLPDDTIQTMNETLELAIDLNCEFANFYCGMAYPGSPLYNIAIQENWELPEEWYGFSQHSYEALPLRTKYIGAEEVLQYRDNAFHKYFENPIYLNMVEEKFGKLVRDHVEEMTKTRLKRKILEEVV